MMLLLADHGDDALCYHVNACTWESKKYGYSAGVCPAVMVVGAGDNTEFVFLMVGVTVVVMYMRRVVRRLGTCMFTNVSKFFFGLGLACLFSSCLCYLGMSSRPSIGHLSIREVPGGQSGLHCCSPPWYWGSTWR
jgi:hypothetical protein